LGGRAEIPRKEVNGHVKKWQWLCEIQTLYMNSTERRKKTQGGRKKKKRFGIVGRRASKLSLRTLRNPNLEGKSCDNREEGCSTSRERGEKGGKDPREE